MLTRAFGLMLAASILPALGCSELANIDAGTCGNGVVEGAEDCDRTGAGCGAPDSASACRFVCKADPDCRPGWRCGIDEVCRVASGSFSHDEMLFTTDGRFNPRVGDFDGDGYDDILSTDLAGVLSVEYRDASGKSGSASFQSLVLPAGVGKLTKDGSDDIAHLGAAAVNVLRGESDRTLAPVAYSPVPVNQADARFVILDGKKPLKLEGDEVRYLGTEILQINGKTVTSVVDDAVLFDLPITAAELAVRPSGVVPVGNFDDRPSSPCDEFLVARSQDQKIYVMTPCKLGGVAWNHDANALPPVQLDGGGVLSFDGVVIGDLNGDNHLDLLIPALSSSPDGVTDLYAAFGVGDGTFHSEPNGIPASGGNGVAKLVRSGVPLPLAVGDVNEDGVGDVLLTDRYLLSTGPGCVSGAACYIEVDIGAQLTEALVAKVNADDHLDVVALTPTRQVTFLSGTGTGLFNPYTIATSGYPRQLVLGDFDGDFVPDVAVVEGDSPWSYSGGLKGAAPEPRGTTATPDVISVLFGRPVGGLDAPVHMGELGSVEAIASGQLPFRGIDFISDLAVLTRDPASSARSVAILGGATNRQMQAPFDLAEAGAVQPDLAFRAEVGVFSGDSHQDIAALAFTPRASLLEKPKPRLWLLESTGEALLSASAAKPADLSTLGIDVCTAAPLRIDMDDDGTDELVMFARPADKAKPGGRIVVARASGGKFSFDAPIDVPDVRFLNETLAQEGCRGVQQQGKSDAQSDESAISGQPLAADVDGDGKMDALFLVAGYDYANQDFKQVNRLLLYRGGFETQNRTDLALPAGHFVSGLALLDIDGDPAIEAVIVSDQGAFAAEFDLPKAALVITRPLLASAGPDVPAPAPSLPFAGTITPILVADFNGDRLPDFALVSEFASQLFYSTPVRL